MEKTLDEQIESARKSIKRWRSKWAKNPQAFHRQYGEAIQKLHDIRKASGQ